MATICTAGVACPGIAFAFATCTCKTNDIRNTGSYTATCRHIAVITCITDAILAGCCAITYRRTDACHHNATCHRNAACHHATAYNHTSVCLQLYTATVLLRTVCCHCKTIHVEDGLLLCPSQSWTHAIADEKLLPSARQSRAHRQQSQT